MDEVANARRAINRIFEDTSVPQSTTREQLTELREEIDMLLGLMDDDD